MTETETSIEKADIGSVLKAAREDKGLSLEDAATTLRIRSDHLRALEEDDFDRLPGSVYAIGFIRTYATHLGLNAAELITRYKSLTQPLHAEDPGYDPQSEPEQISNLAKAGVVAGGIFLVYLIWLIAGGARSPEPVAEVPAAPAAEEEAEADAVAARVVAPAPRPATPPPAAAETPALAAAVAAPVETAAAPAVQAVAPSNDTRAVLPEADPLSSDPPVTVAPIASLTPAEPVKVEIRAERRTWMRIENTEGRVLFSSIIRADETFELTDDDAYTLATRDAGALQFTVDGEAVGAVGRRGQILTARRIARTDVLGLRP